MRLYTPLILVISICSIAASGQQLFVQKYPTEVYQASMQNWRMVQDQQGTLYFANTNGLLIFDGIHWELIVLPDKAYLRSLDVDQNGKVYVGADGEFGYLERTGKGNFEYVSLMPLLQETRRQDVKNIYDVEVWGESVLLCDEDHGYIYRNGKIDVLDKADLWFYQLGDSVYTIRDEQSTLYVYRNNEFTKTDLNLNIKISVITSYKGNLLLMDDKNRIWLVDPNAAPRGKVSVLSENLNASLKELIVKNIRPLYDGRLAILTDREIIIVDLNGEILYKITRSMLGDSNLQSSILYEDAQHNLWFTTDEFIGLIITSSPLTYFDKTNGFQGVVFSLGEQDGQRYVGTNAGLYHEKDGGEFELISGTEGAIWNIYKSDDRLYIAHDNGVFEVMEQKATKLVSHQYPQSLCVLNSHRDCIVMSAYNSGIWLLKKDKAVWRKHKIKGFEEETRFIQEDDKGNLWISHQGKGIWKLRLNEAMDSVVDKKIYTTSHQLPSNVDNRVFKLSDQKIIAATEDGIYSYNESKDILEPDYRFHKVLQGIIIYSLAEAPEGQIYFRGRDKVKEIAGVLTKGVDGTYSALLTPFNKITWADSDAPLIAAQDGAWFGNNNRIIAYDLKQKTYYHEPLQPIIKKVIAVDSIIYTNGTIRKTTTIPYSRNSMLFDFNVMHYEDVEKNEFQYKLLGFDKEWSAWNSTREAHFTNLPEGDYTFVMRARNVYRNRSRIASLAFHIDPPVYRTWWAYSAYAILFVFFFYSGVTLNTRRIRKQKIELQRKVDEKTMELTAMNNEVLAQNEEISAISEDVHKKNEEIREQAEELKKLNLTKDKLFSIISHDLRGPIRQVQDIFNLVDMDYVSEKELKTILPRLKEGVSQTLYLTDNLLYWAKNQMEKGLQLKPVHFDLQEIAGENFRIFKPTAHEKGIHLINNINTSFIAYADKDMIKLVLRNLVNNAIKFTSNGGTVIVGSEIVQGYVIVSVRDTGTGLTDIEISNIFSKETFSKYGTSGEKGTGLGLILCKEFIESNKGTITVESEFGKGSLFTFTIPT